jgi:hypothetical protein
MSGIPSDLIDNLCKAPDSQIDASIKSDLLLLKNRSCEDAKADLLDIIGRCIDYSLCSGFVLSILQGVLYVDVCGGKMEDCVGRVRSDPFN